MDCSSTQNETIPDTCHSESFNYQYADNSSRPEQPYSAKREFLPGLALVCTLVCTCASKSRPFTHTHGTETTELN